MTMKLDENSWIVSAGLTPDWKAVNGRRRDAALAGLKGIAAQFSRRAPKGVRSLGYEKGLRFFLSRGSAERDRLLADPAFDYWLFLWDKHFGMPCDESNWRLQFGLFQGFAASLALLTGRSARLETVLDPDAHLHLYGGPHHLEFPAGLALKPVRLWIGRGRVEVRGPEGLRAIFPGALYGLHDAFRRREGRVVWARSQPVLPGVHAQSCGLLMTQCVIMHGLARPSLRETADFAASLRTAFAHIAERDPGLHAEMTDMVRVLIPLVNTMRFGSVSSSYVNMRGAICLSHDWDPLLQAETLIHEFCHQKMNQLLLADPLLMPGQGGQVFYSPWRNDARRLRGLILGAHAFLNVSRYLLRSLSREPYRLKEKVAVMCNVARRLYEVDAAIRTACGYGSFTEFGSRFMLGLWRETQGLWHAVQWFPPALLKEARLACEKHRGRNCLPLTGIHRGADCNTTVHTLPFGQRTVVKLRFPGETE